MPDGSVPSCGASMQPTFHYYVARAAHWVSPDGSLASSSKAASDLYMRDLVAEETKLIGASAGFFKSTPGAAFFVTRQNLDPADSGSGQDLYRYDIDDEAATCVTCVVPGLQANVGYESDRGRRRRLAGLFRFIHCAAPWRRHDRASTASTSPAAISPT